MVPGITVVELAGELEKNKTNLVTIIDPVPTGPEARDVGPPPGHRPGLYDRSGKTPSSQVFQWADSASWGLYASRRRAGPVESMAGEDGAVHA